MENNSIDLTELEKAKQGKVTGVIIPPPEIRAVVDKTAQFVARNGKNFETKILSSGEGKTAKFNFMKPYDPYHAYYELKIREFEEGKPVITSSSFSLQNQQQQQQQQIQSQQQIQTTSVKATFTSPIARFAMNKPTEAPEPFEFSTGHPPGLSSLDLDVIKLTAQYTAINGREFLSGLAQREQRNPQFDFLKPTHMLFSYFTSLVDAYTKILLPSSTLLQSIQEKTNKMKVLEKCVQRWGWERAEEEKKQRESQQADAEKSAFHAVDWQDFVVVETIDFHDDELLESVNYLENKRFNSNNELNTDMDMDIGDDQIRHPPPPPPPSSSLIDKDINVELDNSNNVYYEEDNTDLNIVSDYKPRLKVNNLQNTKLIDPISGRVLNAEDMSEHMRIQLMDPKWRIEQQRFLGKQQETSYAEGSSIADSLKQFAKQRGDIFGSAEEEEARLLTEEKQRKKRVEETNKVIWDGHQSSLESLKRQKLEQLHSLPPPSIPIIGRPTGPSMLSAVTITTSSGTITGPPPPPILPPPSSILSLPPPPPQSTTTTSSAPQPLFSIPPTPIMSMPLSVPPPPSSLPPQPNSLIPPTIPSYLPMNYPFPPPLPPNASGFGFPSFPPPPINPNIPINTIPLPTTTTTTPQIDNNALIPEDIFASRYPDPITINIIVPNNATANINPAWDLRGQTLSISISVTQTIKDLKDLIGEAVGGMVASKQQLKGPSGFLKDQQTLASLNIGPDITLEMSARSRGGKR